MTEKTNDTVRKQHTWCSVLLFASFRPEQSVQNLEAAHGFLGTQLVDIFDYSCTKGSSEECPHLSFISFVDAMERFR